MRGGVRLCRVTVQVFHTNNRVFTPKSFMELKLVQVQHIRFSGLGPDNENGVPSRFIMALFYMA